MIKIRKKTISMFILIIIFLFVIYSFFTSIKVTKVDIDPVVIFTFIIMFFLTIIGIFRDKRPYSLNKTYWYFNLVFFIMAPLAQYLSNYNMWRYAISNNTYIKANVCIIVGNIIHSLLYKSKKEVSFAENYDKTENKKFVFLLIISLGAFTMLVLNIGFKNLFLRATNLSEFTENRMFNTIITSFLKAVPVYCFTLYYKTNKKMDIRNWILIMIIFLVNFPVSTTRFWMGAIFIGIALLVLVKDNKMNRLQDVIFILTFTVIFPITYLFHFYSLEHVINNGFKSFNLANSYLAVDYDAYSILCRIIDYVGSNGIVLGKQLIGTILFMIPRSIWPNKPQATGAFIATETNQSFTNISSPFISEGIINFGFLGLIVFEIFLTLIIRKLDNDYWSINKNKYLLLVYPYFIGLLLFFERGALHHAVIYTFCFLLPLFIIIIFNLLMTKKKQRR